MWGRRDKSAAAPAAEPRSALKHAMHEARVEAAERTSVVVDLRDAEVARLELLSEALDPLFAEIPSEAELFDRGLSRGDTPRLWIDAVAHVAMAATSACTGCSTTPGSAAAFSPSRTKSPIWSAR